MGRAKYGTDLTDAQWRLLEPLVPAPKEGGRPAKYSRQDLLQAMLYALRAGCPWRLLPHDFPPWKSVYGYFRAWRLDGTLERIHHRLLMSVRLLSGRHAQPSAAILDSQSVKTTEKGGLGATMQAKRSTAARGICW